MLQLIDEGGLPIAGAAVKFGGTLYTSDSVGLVSAGGFQEPVVAEVNATGFLPEPFIFDADDSGSTQILSLRALKSAGGTPRVAIHFGGDAMLGRRFLAPTQPDTATVVAGDGGASARAVVSSLAPLLRAASLRVANVETVIGSLPDTAAYPEKRFIIQSPPEMTAALSELGVDVANLGNNHQRDWLEPGIASTTSALDGVSISRLGAGVTEAEAGTPLLMSANGLKIGFLSYCSINGDSVNDAYPLDADPVPPGLDPLNAWQYEFRSWGFTGPTITIAVASRRVGSAWQLIVAAEAGAPSAAEAASLWTSASTVYPELQDWVARRGHGGANLLDPAKFPGDVAALRSAGADLVVVALHGSFQYAEVKSSGIEAAAHSAITAGADLVVCHHTHVLQGMQWYKGKLICWSLGNCVFDQDFLTTFRSGVLRTVFEGPTLVEARFYPATILRYRPAAVAGGTALSVLDVLHERSDLDFQTTKPLDAVVAADYIPSGFTAKPRFVVEHHAARLEVGPGTSTTVSVTADSLSAADLPRPGLWRSRAPGGGGFPPGLLFGRDLFGYGGFEDDAADGNLQGGLHWNNADENVDKAVIVDPSAWSGTHVLRLHRVSTNSSRVRMRPVARVTFADHRFWHDPGGGAAPVPLDGTATHSLRFRASADNDATGSILLDVYNFDDKNPTEDPSSTAIRSVEIPFTVTGGGDWQELIVDIPDADLAPAGGLEANMAMFYVALYPPSSGETTLRIDDLQFMEWREAALFPDGFFQVDAVRGSTGPVTVDLERREK